MLTAFNGKCVLLDARWQAVLWDKSTPQQFISMYRDVIDRLGKGQITLDYALRIVESYATDYGVRNVNRSR